MAFNQRVTQSAATSGTLNGVSAGTTTAGATLSLAEVSPMTLSCLAVVEAETSTLTMALVWQVSNDGTTWYQIVDANNAAQTVLATGTGGDDAVVSKVVSAPGSVYGWRFARASILSGVTTGATADTYSLRYSYARPDFT